VSFRNVIIALATSFALVACGGSKSSTSSTTTTTQSSPSNGIMTDQGANPSPSTGVNAPAAGTDENGNPMAAGTLATMPPGLNCGAVKPVWVNMKSHVYHEPNDRYYGRTKHGEYMCPSQAKAHGYHKAGTHGKQSLNPTSQTSSQ
jgi:hypothetical protein